MDRKQSRFNEIVSQGLKDAKFSERTFRDFFEKEDKVEFGQFIKTYTTSVFKQAGVHICDGDCGAEKGDTAVKCEKANNLSSEDKGAETGETVGGKTADAKTFMSNINKFLSDNDEDEVDDLEVEVMGDLFEFIGKEIKKLINKPTKEDENA